MNGDGMPEVVVGSIIINGQTGMSSILENMEMDQVGHCQLVHLGLQQISISMAF